METKESKLREYIILKLRLTEGVCIEEVNSIFDVQIQEMFANEMTKLQKMELVELKVIKNKTYLRLTEKGMDLANQVWEEFI